MPSDVRVRCRDEWLAELDVLRPGCATILDGLRLIASSRRMRRELAGTAQGIWWRESAISVAVRPGFDLGVLYVVLVVYLSLDSPGKLGGMAFVSFVAFPFLVTLVLVASGFYKRQLRTPLVRGVVLIAASVSSCSAPLVGMAVLRAGWFSMPRLWVELGLYSLLALVACRALFVAWEHWARRHGHDIRPALIIGAGVVGARIAQRLERDSRYGLDPAGFLDHDPRSVVEVDGRVVPVLGSVEDIDTAVAATGARALIVAFSRLADERLAPLVQYARERRVEISVVPRMFDTINDRIRYQALGGLPILSFDAVNPRGIQFAVKHVLDRVLALVLLVVFAPVMVFAAIAVWVSSPGPVLFAQARVGRDGKVFNFYKLRSMRTTSKATTLHYFGSVDDAHLGPGGVEGKDRRTMVGRVLRRFSIDELPQLFNVLKGDMSLVGPRPERPELAERFEQDIERYGERHRVKAGITGWAQVHGLRGQTSLDERVEWDNYYIAHWSLWLDLKILLMTILTVRHRAE
jgi:exopolysaccharide biosynthesis polyprenyl glycosylphosphotransferase